MHELFLRYLASIANFVLCMSCIKRTRENIFDFWKHPAIAIILCSPSAIQSKSRTNWFYSIGFYFLYTVWHRSIKACNVIFDTWSKNTLEAWACKGEAKSKVISKSTQQVGWSVAVLFVNWSRGTLGVKFQMVVISWKSVASAASACSILS